MSKISSHRLFGLFASCAVSLIIVTSGNGWAETWTSLRGDRSVEARMVGMWDGNVVLDMGNRRVTVPMDSLRSDSRIQAQEIWRGIQSRRQSRIDELQGRAAAASAPAPNPLPTPRPAPPYEKPSPSQKVGDYFQDILTQLEAGHVVVIYDALPPSYQKDVDEVVQLAATKINPAAWQSFTNTFYQVGDLIVTRQNWLFSNPRWEALPSDQFDKFQVEALKMAGFMREAFDPNEIQLSKLQSASFGQWLASRDAALAPYSVAGDTRISDMIELQVVSETADSAVVKLTMGGMEMGGNITLTRVEGQWFPAEFVPQWTEGVAAAKAQLAAAPNATLLSELSAVAMVQPMLLPLTSASDEAAFHEAMETMIDFARPMVMNMAATAGVNVASNNPNSRRSAGYGDGGYGEEDMYDGLGSEDGMYEEEMMEDMEEEMMEGMEDEMMEDEMLGDGTEEMAEMEAEMRQGRRP